MKTITFFIISIIFISGLSTAAHLSQPTSIFEHNEINHQTTHRLLYRITPALHPDDLPRQAELVAGKPAVYHDVFMDIQTKQQLEKKGYHIQELSQQSVIHSSEIRAAYRSFTEMESILETTADQYPDITRLFRIGKSYENRSLWCLEITDHPGVEEDEPGVVYMGLHHAREWPTMEICLQLIEKLTSSYQDNSSIQQLVNQRRIWIIPCANPDGYVYDHDLNQGMKWWRKNRHYFEVYDRYGVDLNRNYPGSCDGDPLGMWGSTGMSHHPDSNVYCGKNQGSELEIQAIQDFFITEDITASISYHTYGELVMWPWGHSLDKTPADMAYMSTVGKNIAGKITSQDGSGTYTPTQSAGLYPTTGDTTDWIYGYHHYVRGRPHFSYTIEACKSFHPDASILQQVCNENIEGAFYLLQEAENISQLTPRVVPPIIADISEQPDQTYKIRWNTVNPASNATVFELEEYVNMQFFKETVEESHTNEMILNHFTVTDQRASQGSFSYRAHTKDGMVSSLSTPHPLFVNQSMDLTFDCWYGIEEHYDKAFVEISTDGRNYEVIDSFTGSSNGWISRRYSLDSYLGKSIFIRFRYATDERKTQEGFYVDNIYPVATYETINCLDNSITNQSYIITEKPDELTDLYYYRVRGYNDAHGWGDFSMLKPLEPITQYNTAPNQPVITGPQRAKPGTSCSYELSCSDLEDHQLYYFISWGDGEIEDWIGPYESDQVITLNHTWSEKGEYLIEVRTKDVLHAKSSWAQLTVAMPQGRNSLLFIDLFYHLLTQFGLSI